MDKYEYNLKLDQMKSLYAEEKYDEAADIADTINWNKVKNVNGLVKAGEVYEKVQRYEESRDILLMAYDRSPIGRMIIYRLAEVSVRMKDFEAAQDYCNEFVEIAPHDTLKYVLRYDLKKAQGASYDELISILEELKEQEYTEEWAYELAYLYHKAGRSEKCIDACDELILWFGDGPYVERALELKMLYQPLTKAQEEKYRSFRQTKDERRGLTHIDVGEMARAGETVHDPVLIPRVEVNTERFNTVNLQEEIARGMQQIINATEKETVADTLDSINRMVEDIPYLKLPTQERAADAHIETDEEIDGSLKLNFQELLGEESDGQISMVMDDKSMVERQITGQITIEEVLQEWERTKRAAETALEEAKQRKLESAKARALQEAGSIMDRLTGAMPKLDAGMTPRELLEEEYLQGDKASAFVPKKEEIAEEPAVPQSGIVLEREPARIDLQELQPEPQAELAAGSELEIAEPAPEPELERAPEPEPEMAAAPELEREPEPAAEPEIAEPEPPAAPSAEPAPELEQELEREPEAEPVSESEQAPEPEQELEREPEPGTAEPEQEPPTPSSATSSSAAPVAAAETELWPEGVSLEEMVRAYAAGKKPEPKKEPEQEPTPEQEPPEPPTSSSAAASSSGLEEVAMANPPEKPTYADEREEEFAFVRRRASWKAKTVRMPQIDIPEDLGKEKEKLLKLTDEQKAIFSYFMPVKGMESQLCEALTAAVSHIKNDKTAASGNLVIQGGQGSGKTTLATSVIKVLQQETGALDGKIGKIHAEALNKKDVGELLSKVEGGCLIIEQAGALDEKTAAALSQQMEQNTTGLFVILEDSSKSIKDLFARSERLAKQFGERISVPIFTNDELVTFARSYSRELGYKIDDMAVLALYNRIGSIQRLDQATTLTEVKEIVDEAIDREAHGGLKKAISILTASRYTDDDRIVLTEKDFK